MPRVCKRVLGRQQDATLRKPSTLEADCIARTWIRKRPKLMSSISHAEK